MKFSKRASRVLIGYLVMAAGHLPLYAGDSARELYKQGQAAESRGNYDEAFSAYQKALANRPHDLHYKTSVERIRALVSMGHVHRGEQLLQQGNITGAVAEFLRAAVIDPSNAAAQQAIANLQTQQAPLVEGTDIPPLTDEQKKRARMAGPIELQPVSNDSITLHMVEDVKVVYQAIGKAAGLNVLFDADYNSKRIPIDLTSVTLSEALRIVGVISGTFWKPVTPNTIFVAQNTRTKHTDLDPLSIQTFYLSNASQQNDANEVVVALRNLLDPSIKVYLVPSQNAIVMRATPDQLLLAGQVIDDLDKAKPEILIDIEILQVDRDKLRKIGLSLPGSVGLQPQTTSTATDAKLNLNDLAHLTAKNFAVTVGAATVDMLLSDSDTQVLQNPRVRATDGQKATLKIGSRIPIATGSFSAGAAAATASPLVQTQFTYIDIGVNVDLQPTVQANDAVSIKLKAEVSSQSGTVTISGVSEPIISQQSIEQSISLKAGETSILGGLLEEDDNHTVAGTPGLGELPVLKYFFSSRQHETKHEEIVFLITPRLVRLRQINTQNTRQIDTGTGASIELREMQPSATGAASKVTAKPSEH
jgi:general secretion pathway protein D